VILGDASDEQLVDAARQGERDALDLLLRRHYDRIHAVCRRIAGTTRDADDAAQEALIRIVRALDRFDGRASFATWTYRIATNTALDELRKRGRRPQLHVAGDPFSSSSPATEPVDELAQRRVESGADRLAIESALADLPEEFRVPVVMRDVGDLDYAEIAEALGVPIGTVKSRIARGRRMLLERLGNRDDPSRRPTDEHGGTAPIDPSRPATTAPPPAPPPTDP
jgi:RNA polymerase sigma-70 factor (ECF subfamily)